MENLFHSPFLCAVKLGEEKNDNIYNRVYSMMILLRIICLKDGHLKWQ